MQASLGIAEAMVSVSVLLPDYWCLLLLWLFLLWRLKAAVGLKQHVVNRVCVCILAPAWKLVVALISNHGARMVGVAAHGSVCACCCRCNQQNHHDGLLQ
jgi:hypothetical protein